MARARQLGPIIPRPAHHDPEGTEPLVASASADWRRRLRRVRAVYVELLDSIPREEVTVNAKRYTYRLWPDMLSSADALVDAILLEGGAEHPWLWSNYVEAAYVRGTARAVRNLARQSTAYRSSRATVRDALQTPAYARRTAMVRARVFEEMKGLGGQVKSDMGRLLADGVARGKGPLEIARNLSEQLGIEEYRAERIARTEVNTALRRARWDETEDAQAAFALKSMEMHLSALSPTTRVEHAARHGKLFTLEASRDWFAEGSNSINCFLPGTVVRGRFVAGSKARYQGDAINLVTGRGNKLSVTPNHPVMTARGWVPACEIKKGDHIVSHAIQLESRVGPVDLHDEQRGAAVEDVYGALLESGHRVVSGVHAVDFHGDGACMDEYVDVVTVERPLVFGCDVALGQRIDDLALVLPDSSVTHVSCPRLQSLFSVNLPASGGECGRGDIAAAFGGEIGVPVERCTALVAPFDAVGIEDAAHDGCAESESQRDALGRLSGQICPDEVLFVERSYFSGHVYDLEEVSGIIIAENATTSNCKCSTVTVLVNDAGEPLVPGVTDSAAVARRKYEERYAESE